MQFCTKCGRARNADAGFCTGCGNKFTDVKSVSPVLAKPDTIFAGPATNSDFPARAAGRSLLPDRDLSSPFAAIPAQGRLPQTEPTDAEPSPDVPDSPESEQPDPWDGGSRRSFQRWLWPVVIAVVVLAGGAVVGIMLAGQHHAHPGAAASSPANSGHPAAKSTPSAPPTTTLTTPPTTPATSPVSTGPVQMAPGVAGSPQAAPILSLLNSYFGAINDHNYQGYISLLTPAEQQGLTPAQFTNGFATTRDSAEMLTGISAADGSTVAAVTFTSHQDPADSVNGAESCTTWHISLYLQQAGTGYLIGQPPSSYQPSDAACA